MKEYRKGKAIIRVHGQVERERVEAATIDFLKKVERIRRKKEIKVEK